MYRTYEYASGSISNNMWTRDEYSRPANIVQPKYRAGLDEYCRDDSDCRGESVCRNSVCSDWGPSVNSVEIKPVIAARVVQQLTKENTPNTAVPNREVSRGYCQVLPGVPENSTVEGLTLQYTSRYKNR